MAGRKGQGAPVLDLADRIAADIVERGLQPGDPYLSTADAAKRFHVSGATVHRALQLLSQRGRLIRRQRSGAFVADPEARAGDARLRRVRLMVYEGYLRTEGLLGDGLLVGLQRRLPKAELQFHYLPAYDEEASAAEAVADALRSREPEGFVLVRASSAMQRRFEQSGLPTVVVGSLQPSITRLASIDRDQGQIGALLADRLIERKCRTFVVLMRERMSPGDHRLLDAALAALARHGASLNDVRIRCLPADPTAIEASVTELLQGVGSRVGLLCRSEPLARGAALAVQRRQDLRGARAASRRGEIVLADYYLGRDSQVGFTFAASTLSPETWGERIGDMLLRQAQGESGQGLHEVIPVVLVDGDA